VSFKQNEVISFESSFTTNMSASKRARTDRKSVAPLVVFNLVNSYPVELHRRFERSIYRSVYNITHNLSEYSNLFDIEYEIDNMFDQIISPLIARARRNDVVSAYIRHSSLEKPIFIIPQKAGSFEPKSFLGAIYRVSQSNRTFLLDG
jgi:hypothetical protein